MSSERFQIKPTAEGYIGSMQNGSAEKIYAIDYFAYVLRTNDGEKEPHVYRPKVGEYMLGSRVAEAIRGRIVENPND